MSSVNQITLIGNITRDAEIRQVGQSQVAKFGVATSERYRNAAGETVEETEFHNVELWGKAPVHPYLKKGQLVFVQGSIKTDKWTDQQGQERSSVKVKAFTIQLLGARPQAQPQSAPAQQPPAQMPQRPAYPPQPAYPGMNPGMNTVPGMNPAQPAYPPQPAYPTPTEFVPQGDTPENDLPF